MSEVLAAGGAARDDAANERYYLASQWQLIRRKFARHKLAKAGLVVLAVLYVVSMFAEFFATQGHCQARYRPHLRAAAAHPLRQGTGFFAASVRLPATPGDGPGEVPQGVSPGNRAAESPAPVHPR